MYATQSLEDASGAVAIAPRSPTAAHKPEFSSASKPFRRGMRYPISCATSGGTLPPRTGKWATESSPRARDSPSGWVGMLPYGRPYRSGLTTGSKFDRGGSDGDLLIGTTGLSLNKNRAIRPRLIDSNHLDQEPQDARVTTANAIPGITPNGSAASGPSPPTQRGGRAASLQGRNREVSRKLTQRRPELSCVQTFRSRAQARIEACLCLRREGRF